MEGLGRMRILILSFVPSIIPESDGCGLDRLTITIQLIPSDPDIGRTDGSGFTIIGVIHSLYSFYFELCTSYFFLNLYSSHNSVRTPNVDFGCRNAIFNPSAPFLGIRSISSTPLLSSSLSFLSRSPTASAI